MSEHVMDDIEKEQVSLENHLSEKYLYTSRINRINKDISELSVTNKINKPIIIQKNDSMNKRIDELIKTLDEGNSILLSAKSNTIAKLIGIVEIVKTKTKTELQQFNKLIKQKSVNNPNYNYSKKTTKQKDNLSNDLTPQTYMLPILLIYLAPSDFKVELDWTKQ